MWNFSKFKNNVALIDINERVLYKDLIIYSSKIEKKIGKKSLTLMLADNSLSSIICYVSLVKKRLPVLILDYKISKIFLNKIVKLYKPQNICLSIENIFFKNNKNYKLNFKFKSFNF